MLPKSDLSEELAKITQAERVNVDGSRIKHIFGAGLFLMCSRLRAGPIEGDDVFMVAKNLLIIHKVLNGKVGKAIRENLGTIFEWWRTLSMGYDYGTQPPMSPPEDLVEGICSIVTTYDKLALENRVTALELAEAAIHVDQLLMGKYADKQRDKQPPASHIEVTTTLE